MIENVQIADFSGVYEEENLGSRLREAFPGLLVKTVSLSDIEGSQCYCDPDAETMILDRMPPFPGGGFHVRFVDSGDYHYMSCLALQDKYEPFALLLLDNHSDMQQPMIGDVLSCGGWVRTLALRNPNMRKVLSIGPSGKCTLYGPGLEPWHDEPLSEAVSFTVHNCGGDLPVFISIDKDVLREADASTNWDQGNMTLSTMETILQAAFSSGVRVLGADICGEKPSSKGGHSHDHEINANTNIKIINILSYLTETKD